MRSSYGFQVALALLGIGLYVFAVGYGAVHTVSYFQVRREYRRAAEFAEIGLGRFDTEMATAPAKFRSAEASLFRAAGISVVALVCGVGCTVAARRIQRRRDADSPEELLEPADRGGEGTT